MVTHVDWSILCALDKSYRGTGVLARRRFKRYPIIVRDGRFGEAGTAMTFIVVDADCVELPRILTG